MSQRLYYLYTFESNKEVEDFRKIISDNPNRFPEEDFFRCHGLAQMSFIEKKMGNKTYEGWGENDHPNIHRDMLIYTNSLKAKGYVDLGDYCNKYGDIVKQKFMNADLSSVSGMFCYLFEVE